MSMKAIASIALWTCTAGTVLFTNHGNTRVDGWAIDSNWDDHVPSGTQNAVVGAGVTVTADSDDINVFSGSLTLRANSLLRLAWTSRTPMRVNRIYRILRASHIEMESGSELRSNLPRGHTFPPISLHGDAAVTMPSTGTHGRNFNFNEIDGAYRFSLTACHRCRINFRKTCTTAETVVSVIGFATIRAFEPNALGRGDVTINLGPLHGQQSTLVVRHSEAFSTSATLALYSNTSRFGAGKHYIRVIKDVTMTVAFLVVDDVSVPPGTYSNGFEFGTLTVVGQGSLIVRGLQAPKPVMPVLLNDFNPLGEGTIPGAHGLLIMIFGDEARNGIHVDDLRTISISRRFPSSYTFPGILHPQIPVHPRDRRNWLTTDEKSAAPNGFCDADMHNINFIICPFLGTLVNEGALPLKQSYTKQELQDVTTLAGLDPEVGEGHIGGNFLHDPDLEQDIWNMEGFTNEHVTSTGIHDCATAYTFCDHLEPPNATCVTATTRACRHPDPVKFEEFVEAVDINGDDFITSAELEIAGEWAEEHGMPVYPKHEDDEEDV